jgi:hypothetical protein
MRVSEIITRLRTKLPSETWGSRVFGIAELTKVTSGQHKPPLPSMYISYGGANASSVGDRNSSTLIQDCIETVEIYVVLDNRVNRDRTAINAQDQIHDIRKALWLALLYWNIDVYNDNDQGFQYNEFRFVGDEFSESDPERYFHKFTFDISFNIQNQYQGIGSHNPETIDDLITLHGTIEPTFFTEEAQPALEFDVDLTP